ncbi:MAG: SVM family protein [Pigeon pea little leaf phytoplasma]|uniref:SVM family protein n=1 Tax=Candidatus Phytoplasma fabacearum TaxID=2982628 RepID=A0ABU8ZSA6_9MOLU|nr:SVM family protein ['Bituminaria bituminosa' little leaf phytoplasma]MDV3148652.1 SVM family protein [Pigeon pea little leaf phytoplasma]MDO7983686.1 SVM family protein ['Bituminaria bituminosa' little leaf phytoplasma]MDO8023981.1 SVM family protein ['Bituminaria bituminosa' little leaf phytoplasma]MDO8030698.1 SVM family protein ['Bituminaria bituminosa' little leaf phytoplasma]MDV3154161.1 SVM family protein [Pigeon pea little leaf phytoplasma]
MFFLIISLGLFLINNNQVMAMDKLNSELNKETNINKCQEQFQQLEKMPKYSKEDEKIKNDNLEKQKNYFFELFIKKIIIKLMFIEININF